MTTAIAAARRRRAAAPRRGGPSLARLLAGEVAWAARQAIHPVKFAAAALVAVGVGLLLGPTTPGPVLGGGWRLGTAALLGVVALAMAHALLQRRSPARGVPADGGTAPADERDLLEALRILLAVTAVLLVGTFVTAYLLAVITGAPADGAQTGLTASLPIDRPMLLVAGLLLVGVLSAGMGHRLAVPGALLFLGVGMLIGSDGLGWVALDDPQLVQSLGVVALTVILFDGGLSTTTDHVRSGVGPGLALATIGVAVTAGVTALGATMLLDLPPRLAWLVGAIVASTDASAVFAMVRRTPIPQRLAAILQIESGANDPVAILLTVGLLSSWNAPPSAGEWLAFGATQLLGGVVVGALAGWVGAGALRRIDLGATGLYPMLALAVGWLAYGTAVAFGGSGFLAVYVTGVVIASSAPRRRTGVRTFVGVLASGVEVGLFLLLGLLVFPSQLPAVAAVSLGVVALLVLVARPLATVLSLVWFDLSRREVAAVGWLGLRGAVPIVLATLAYSAGVAEAEIIFDVVFFIVLASAVLHGLTSTRVLSWLDLPEAPDLRTAVVVSAMPLDAVGVDVVEVRLASGSPLVGRRLAAADVPTDALVVSIVRDEGVIVPRGETRLLGGDRLVITTRDTAGGLEGIIAWAASAEAQVDGVGR